MSTDRLAALLAEYAELEKRLADPAIHADQAAARRVGRRFAELTPIHKTAAELDAPRADLAAARELADEDAGFAAEADELAAAAAGARGAAGRAARAARPQRRQGRDPRGQGRRGRRGVGAVRRRPAADVPALRRAPGLGHRGARHPGLRPRRGQGRLGRDQDQGRARGRVRRVVAAEVGGRRAPGPAGAGHRVAGPHPHLGRRRAGHAGGRRRPRSRSTRATCASTCSARPARAASRSTPPTPRSGSRTCRPGSCRAARTSGPSCRTRTGRCACCGPSSPSCTQEQAAAAASDARKAQIRTVDRSERIRTYNFPQNRISDHRIGYTAYNLDLAVAGDLDGVLDALTEADRAARIGGQDLERH